MESNFFSGSENLYKYMVSIGITLLVLTVYYPLDNKEKLELEKIELLYEVKILNKSLKDNKKKLETLKSKNVEFEKKLHSENLKNHEVTIKKNNLISIKSKFINYYTFIFWIFFPIGAFLIIFGFIKWFKNKNIEDVKSKLEEKKLKLEIKKLKKDL